MKTERFNSQCSDRYILDFGQCSSKNGFAQVDTEQDAWYYGTWANPYKLIIVNYCEGDVTVQRCESEQEFAETLRKIKAWNEKQGFKKFGIDGMCNDSLISKFKSIGVGDLLW